MPINRKKKIDKAITPANKNHMAISPISNKKNNPGQFIIHGNAEKLVELLYMNIS